MVNPRAREAVAWSKMNWLIHCAVYPLTTRHDGSSVPRQIRRIIEIGLFYFLMALTIASEFFPSAGYAVIMPVFLSPVTMTCVPSTYFSLDTSTGSMISPKAFTSLSNTPVFNVKRLIFAASHDSKNCSWYPHSLKNQAAAETSPRQKCNEPGNIPTLQQVAALAAFLTP